MKIYLRIISICYLLGAVLHALDLFDLRLKFSEMDLVWRAWIVYLLVADSAASVGLWRQKRWGVALFLVVAVSQIIAYTGFTGVFGNQLFLVLFHLTTLGFYGILRARTKE